MPPSQTANSPEPNLKVEEISFLLLEGFTHLALSACIEVLRVANLLRDRDLYRWRLIAPGGGTQISSNGLVTQVHDDLINLRAGTDLYVVSGKDVEHKTTRSLQNYLRFQARHGVNLGAICSGAHVLASAGLLSGKTCAVHWEYYSAFRENFPDITLSNEAFVAQARPFTASGGTAGAELMLNLIGQKHGYGFSREIGDQLVMPAIRSAGDAQRMPIHIRYGTRNSIILQTLEYMYANVEEPLSTAEISDFIGVSVRQIERVFRKHLGQSPKRFYKCVRLEHARNLLTTTDMSIIKVALASGFKSPSHFSKVYRAEYGETPYSQSKHFRDA